MFVSMLGSWSCISPYVSATVMLSLYLSPINCTSIIFKLLRAALYRRRVWCYNGGI